MTTAIETTWQHRDDVPVLDADDVHIWRIDLDAARPDYDASRALLTADELLRADRYRFDPPRRTYVAGRAVLRRILARYLDVEPAALRFRYGEHGKPELEGAALAFNLSHCERWALLAVAREGRLGVDVEKRRQLRDMDGVADVCFSERELAAYHAASDRVEAFYNAWTRKEAFVKALGSGIAFPLKSFVVTLEGPGALIQATGLKPQNWTLAALAVAPEYAGAVAIERRDARLHALDYGP